MNSTTNHAVIDVIYGYMSHLRSYGVDRALRSLVMLLPGFTGLQQGPGFKQQSRRTVQGVLCEFKTRLQKSKP